MKFANSDPNSAPAGSIDLYLSEENLVLLPESDDKVKVKSENVVVNCPGKADSGAVADPICDKLKGVPGYSSRDRAW